MTHRDAISQGVTISTDGTVVLTSSSWQDIETYAATRKRAVASPSRFGESNYAVSSRRCVHLIAVAINSRSARPRLEILSRDNSAIRYLSVRSRDRRLVSRDRCDIALIKSMVTRPRLECITREINVSPPPRGSFNPEHGDLFARDRSLAIGRQDRSVYFIVADRNAR